MYSLFERNQTESYEMNLALWKIVQRSNLEAPWSFLEVQPWPSQRSISGYQLLPWTLTLCDVLSALTSSEVMCGLLTQSRRLEDLCVLARPVPATFRSTCSQVPTGSARVPTGSNRVSLGCHGILCSNLWLKQIYPCLFWVERCAGARASADCTLVGSEPWVKRLSKILQKQQPNPLYTTATRTSLNNNNNPHASQKNNYYPNRLNQQQQQPRTKSTPATKHNNNPNRLKHDSNAQTTAPTSLPHHNTSPPLTTTRTSWNVNSNNPNLLGQHKQLWWWNVQWIGADK